MVIVSPNGITTPDGSQEVKIIPDLSAMATSIDNALERRANHFRGSSTDREAFRVDAPEGVFWTDTTGEKATWVKQGSSWVRVWPSPTPNLFRVGGYDRDYGSVFFNMRNLMPDGSTRAGTFQLITSEDSDASGGVYITNFKDGETTSGLRLNHLGNLHVRQYGTTNWQSVTPSYYPSISYKSPFTAYASNTGNNIKVSLINRVLYLRGIAGIASSGDIEGNTGVEMASLSSGLNPSSTHHFRCQGSGTDSWLMTVNSSGSITASRYSGSGTNVWLPFSVAIPLDL